MARALRSPWLPLFLLTLLAILAPHRSHAHASPPGKITRVQIHKRAHAMELYAGETRVASYRVAIGPGGLGPKLKEGDMVTPTGRYHVIRHQKSQYKVFLRLDYPNAQDRARFAELTKAGKLPRGAKIGGDIGIHGPPVKLDDAVKPLLKEHDWTAGCVAVNEDEIMEVAGNVADGTIVDIED